jgi:phage shock protein A
MSLFKRISTTFTARVERLVGGLENHDAAVEATIVAARKAYARARVRHQRLEQAGTDLAARLGRLQETEQQWEARALSSAGKDEATALECLRRRNLCREQRAALVQALERHRAQESRLAAELQDAARRIEDMSHQRQIMRTREATADASARLAGLQETVTLGLGDAFERWEERVTEAEAAVSRHPLEDPLEAEFLAEEQRRDLQAELAALKREREAGHEN